jgi:hypothetical protein
MLTRVQAAEPRLRCGHHAGLLATAILGIVVARSSSIQIAVEFACYGALHGGAVAICLEPRPARWRALAFVAAAALLSGTLARAGLPAAQLLAGRGVQAAAWFVVAVSAFAGAFGYGALMRYWLRYPLAPGRLLIIALACTFAACVALVPMRQYPSGGTAWLAIFWWLAFSGGLCTAPPRPRPAREPPEAMKQRMP